MAAHHRALIVLTLTVVAGSACRQTSSEPQADPLMEAFRHQAQEEGLTQSETNGKRLFGHYCATCHGETGGGDGQNASNLDPAPTDFHDSLKAHPPSYSRQIVEGGTVAVGRSPLCPPWGRSLAREDVDALMAYLQVLARPLKQPPAAAAAPPGAP